MSDLDLTRGPRIYRRLYGDWRLWIVPISPRKSARLRALIPGDAPSPSADRVGEPLDTGHTEMCFESSEFYTALQSQKAVSANLQSEQMLHFGFARQYVGIK